MHDIDLETFPEPYRDRLRDAAISPNGSVIKENGEELARVLPKRKRPAKSAAEVNWTAAKNERRCDLIDREIDGTIAPGEWAELEELQEELRRYVNQVAPLPLEPLRKLHQALLEKAAKATVGPPT
jgi:hypothetical protein